MGALINGRLFCDFLDRNPHLSLINSLPICEGKITRMRKTSRELEINLLFSPIKQDRIEIFEFRNQESQILFKKLTSDTQEFSNCFNNELDFEIQANNWRKLLNKYYTNLSRK
jgi:hypothetical protein